MAIVRLMAHRQLVFTLVLVVVFWTLYARLHKAEFFGWWGLAWTAFLVYLANTALVLQLGPEWTPLKSTLILFSVLARFLQIPLLVFAAWSMRLQKLHLRRWLKPALGLALVAGALTFAASFMYRNQPVISISLRSVPYTLGLAAASLFYALSFFERWQRNRSSPATILAGVSCLLYALDQGLLSTGYIHGLIAGPAAVRQPFDLPLLARSGLIVGPAALRQSLDFPLLVHPAVLFLELLSGLGLCLGMVLLVTEERRLAESDSQGIAGRKEQTGENDAALSAEISELQRVEQALKEENEDRYRDLVERSEDLLCTHDLRGRLLSVNQAAARLLGYEIEELLRIPMPDLLVPSFRDKFDSYILRIQKKGEAFGLMAVLTRAGKERIWKYHNRLRADGVLPPIVQGIAHDVTGKIKAERHLRQSEAKFAIAFRSNPSAMMITTLADGQFMDVNDAFESQTGYARDEVVGHTARDLGLWMDADDWEGILTELQRGVQVKDREVRLCTKAKHPLTVSYSAEIIDLQGKPCLLAVIEDITARKQAEEKLRNLSSHLVRAQEEERARIARELHDDVSQRLAVLAMHLEELKGSSLNSMSSHIQRIDEVSKLTSEISADVRTVSHRLHPALLDFLGLQAALSEFCAEFAKVNAMEIEFVHHEVPPTLPNEVTLCLYRVTQEAVRNAQKHSGCRQVRVELTGASDSVRLRVSDSGAGFDPASVQSDRLGLISMTERLRSLGGELSVDSRRGHGTSIEARVFLPAGPTRQLKNSKQASGR